MVVNGEDYKADTTMLKETLETLEERDQVLEALRETNRRLELLSNTASQLLVSENPQGLVQSLCEAVMKHLDCHVFFNFLVNEDRGCLHLNACAGIPEDERMRIQWLDYGTAVCGCVARDGCRVVAEDIPSNPDPRTDLVQGYGVKAYACHPLLAQGGKVIGTLSFGSRRKTHFHEDELALMKTVTDQVAVAMEKIRLLESERKHAEALRVSESKLRRLIDSGVLGVIYSNASGSITDANDAFLEMVGYSRHDLVSEKLRWDDMTPPEYSHLDEFALNESAKYGRCTPFEKEYIRKDGSRVPIMIGFAPLDGCATDYICFILDMTREKQVEEALRESEEQFRTMVDAIPQLAWMGEPDGFIFWFNQRWYEYTGRTPDEVEGWNWQDVIDPEMRQRVIERWQTSIATGEPYDMEFPIRGADGAYRWFLTRIVPLNDANGNVTRWFGTSTDVSDKHELQAQQQEFYRRTILAATAGKLVVTDRVQTERLKGQLLGRWVVSRIDELASIREGVTELAKASSIATDSLYALMSCVGEATSNALKHAGKGTAFLYHNGDRLVFMVEDLGKGIGALNLPDVALITGYSTAGTGGYGYKVMIKCAEKVYLATDSEGTTLALEIPLSG